MSTKEEKPTLAGVNVKTRKRNIVVPADPGSFATAIVQIFQVGVRKGAQQAACCPCLAAHLMCLPYPSSMPAPAQPAGCSSRDACASPPVLTAVVSVAC